MKKLYIFLFLLFLLIPIIFILIKTDKEGKKIWTTENSLSQVSVPALIDNNGSDSLIQAIDYSLIYLSKRDSKNLINFGNDKYSIEHIINSLEDFKEKLTSYGLSEQFFAYIKNNYIFYNSNAERVLFTGYYEASLSGSFEKSEVYKYPVYRKPDDLVRIELGNFTFFKNKEGIPGVIKGRVTENNRIIPFYSRDEIDDNKKLAEKGLEILWVDDPVDLFFLQIQGSGIVRMDDGSSVRINYSESNGHPYRAIGKYLVDMGYLELKDVTMQSIRKFLKNNPEKITDIFNYNPSYVFFRVVEDGPIGSIGVIVTPYRSIATDKKIFPKGAICFIKTKIPVFDENNQIIDWKEFTSFVLNQDTGGAIRSPGRVDIFTGFGESSELVAGHLKEYGELYFLIKK